MYQAAEIFGLDEKHFLPLSQTCRFLNGTPKTEFEFGSSHDVDSQKIVKFCPNKKNRFDELNLGKYSEILFPVLPQQIFREIEWISPDPLAWFVGQFAKYVLRPQPWFLKEIFKLKKLHPGKRVGISKKDKEKISMYLLLF